MTGVDQLDPLEQYVDDLLRFENAERYAIQSRATEAGAPAPLPPRRPALSFTHSDTERN